jgi:hypothetical protein
MICTSLIAVLLLKYVVCDQYIFAKILERKATCRPYRMTLKDWFWGESYQWADTRMRPLPLSQRFYRTPMVTF